MHVAPTSPSSLSREHSVFLLVIIRARLRLYGRPRFVEHGEDLARYFVHAYVQVSSVYFSMDVQEEPTHATAPSLNPPNSTPYTSSRVGQHSSSPKLRTQRTPHLLDVPQRRRPNNHRVPVLALQITMVCHPSQRDLGEREPVFGGYGLNGVECFKVGVFPVAFGFRDDGTEG